MLESTRQMQQEAMEAITNNNHHHHHHHQHHRYHRGRRRRRRRRRHHYHNRHGRGCQRRASQHNKGAREECESTSEQTRQCGRYLPRRHSIKMLSRECSGLSRGVGTRREEHRRGSEGGPRRMRAGELSKRRPARDIKGCCAAAPTGRDERETREKKREREQEGGKGEGEEASRGVVGPKVRRDQGRLARQNGARQGEARPGSRSRAPNREGPGPRQTFEKRDSPRPTSLARAHLYSFISVDLFVGGPAPALHPWLGNRPVLTRHRDNIAPRRG